MFKVGDEVVCIDARQVKGRGLSGLVLGKSYQVIAFHQCSGGRFIDVGGLPLPVCIPEGKGLGSSTWQGCDFCGLESSTWWFSWRFVKLPKQTVEHEETTEA